jgi:hypothetical protein
VLAKRAGDLRKETTTKKVDDVDVDGCVTH